jgi:hypothetical protein
MKTWLSSLLQHDPHFPNLNSIRFDTTAWNERKRKSNVVIWQNEKGDALTLHLVKETHNLPPIRDTNAVRKLCRDLATSGNKRGGTVIAEGTRYGGVPAIRTVYKYESLPAYGYTAMIILPFKDFWFQLTMASVERGVTGQRDAFVTASLAQEGKLELESFDKPDSKGATGRIKGWFQDPYDPNYSGLILRSISDDEKYDTLFPQHPLTKVRHWLGDVPSLVEIGVEKEHGDEYSGLDNSTNNIPEEHRHAQEESSKAKRSSQAVFGSGVVGRGF